VAAAPWCLLRGGAAAGGAESTKKRVIEINHTIVAIFNIAILQYCNIARRARAPTKIKAQYCSEHNKS
jgi:hypothetical protein